MSDISRFATNAIAQNPFIQGSKAVLGGLVRSEPFQNLRNAVVDNTPGIGLPERTFIKAMTGGDTVTAGGIELNDDQLARLKQAYSIQKAPTRTPIVREFEPDRFTTKDGGSFYDLSPEKQKAEIDFFNKNFRAHDNNRLAKFNSPYITTYAENNADHSGYGRDLKMTFGGLSMRPTPEGGMNIQDQWKIDDAATVAADKNSGFSSKSKDTFDRKIDLVEGGNIPSIIASVAKGLGTYEPINIDKTISPNHWQDITPREASFEERVTSNISPGLSKLNEGYDFLKRLAFK
jgi:hypothetical protein